ncbi:DEKNAAC101239, partial [Brettanomyces naardenensis]
MDLKPRSMHGRLPALISPDYKYHGTGLRLSRLALRKVRWKHLILLGIVWVLTIHYFERTVVYRAFNKCQWSNWEKWSDDSYPHHAVVIGDPQIVDAFSYPTRPRPL